MSQVVLSDFLTPPQTMPLPSAFMQPKVEWGPVLGNVTPPVPLHDDIVFLASVLPSLTLSAMTEFEADPRPTRATMT